MIDVRQACGALGDGGDGSRDRPDPSPDTHTVAGAADAAAGEEVQESGEGTGEGATGTGAVGAGAALAPPSGETPCVGDAAADARDGEANAVADGQEETGDPQEGLGDGVPISIACSGDGGTVAVVVTG